MLNPDIDLELIEVLSTFIMIRNISVSLHSDSQQLYWNQRDVSESMWRTCVMRPQSNATDSGTTHSRDRDYTK